MVTPRRIELRFQTWEICVLTARRRGHMFDNSFIFYDFLQRALTLIYGRNSCTEQVLLYLPHGSPVASGEKEKPELTNITDSNCLKAFLSEKSWFFKVRDKGTRTQLFMMSHESEDYPRQKWWTRPISCDLIVNLLFSIAEPAQMGNADGTRDCHSNGSALWLFSHPVHNKDHALKPTTIMEMVAPTGLLLSS